MGVSIDWCVRTVCIAINTYLGPRYLKIPKGDSLNSTVNSFEEKLGFPQVLGAVDGTHIPINKPKEDSQSYFSYKMKYTLNVLGVCDSMGRFIDMDINWPGRTHNAKVFSNSRINKSMPGVKSQSCSEFCCLGETKFPF